MVAALVMGIAVAGVLSGLSTSVRNASRLTQYDRVTLLARSKMNELLLDPALKRNVPMQGVFDSAPGWSATIQPFEAPPGTGPGQWVLDRVQLEVWWTDGVGAAREFSLEGFRRDIAQNGRRAECAK